MADEVLVTVRIDKPKNQDELTKLTNQIVQQRNEVKTLETAIKTLSKAEGDNSALIKAATKNLEIKKQQLNQNVASQKALVNVINAETKSLNALKAENAQLIRQRNALNIETEEGRAGIQKINDQIDANNAKIKENISATEKQRLNIGNYASALDGVIPGLSGMYNGILNVTKAGLAFIATPLGLVLAGVALALAPIVSYLTSTGEGMDKVNRETEGLNSVLTVLKDKFNAIGKGELGASNEAGNAFLEVQKKTLQLIKTLGAPFLVPFQKVIDKYNEAAEAGRQYADDIDAINDSESLYRVEAAKIENQIKSLVIQSKNRTLSETERIALIDKALALEGTLDVKRKQFAADELSALIKLNKERLKGVKIIQGISDTGEEIAEDQAQFAERAAKNVRDTSLKAGDELAESLIDALLKVSDAEAASLALTEKLNSQRDVLDQKIEDARLKRLEDDKKAREKRAEETEKDSIEEYEFQKGIIDQANKDKQDQRDKELDAELAYYVALEKIGQANRDKEKKQREDQLKQQVKTAELLSEQTGGILLNAIAQNGKIAKELAKQLAYSLIDIFVKQLSAQAIADSIAKFGPIAGSIRGAISVSLIRAAGAFAKNAIEGFATGGIVGNAGIAVTRSNGDDRLITAKKNEVVLTTTQRARIGDDNLRRAGVPGFATGGIVGNETRIAANRAESQFDFNQMAGLLNQVRTILVLEDFEAKQTEVNGIQNRAKIIG